MRFVRLVFWGILLFVGAIIGDRCGVPDWARALPDKALNEVAKVSPFGSSEADIIAVDQDDAEGADGEAIGVESSEPDTVDPEVETSGGVETESAAIEVDGSVADVDANALECGQASYYADSLAGNPTASGEPYDPNKLTAAHKTLELGTKLKVVRTDTNAAVDVTVNDRGPFTPGRIVDLSRSAAEDIDLTTAGVTEVCIYQL